MSNSMCRECQCPLWSNNRLCCGWLSGSTSRSHIGSAGGASPGVPKLPVAKADRHYGCSGSHVPKISWALSDWFHAAGCSTEKTSFSKRLQYFKRRLPKQFPQLDLRLHMGESEATSPDKICGSRQPQASTLVLLLFLVDLAMLTDNLVDALQPLRLIVGMPKHLLDHCDCKLQDIICPEDPQSWQEAACMLMGDKVIFMVTIDGVGHAGNNATLPALLAQCRTSGPDFVYHFLFEVATHFDDALPDSWLDSCKSLLPAIIASRTSARAPLDMDVVHELGCLQSSSEIRITKQMNRNSRVLGLHLHGGDHFLDTLSCRQLALVSCRCFQQSKSVAIAVDCKRFGGKHWLAGIVCCTAKHVATFANPVAFVCYCSCLVFYNSPQTVLRRAFDTRAYGGLRVALKVTT